MIPRKKPLNPRLYNIAFGQGPGQISRDELFKRLLTQESGNRQFNPDGSVVTSSAGARGATQLMMPTAIDPGMNVNNIYKTAESLNVPYNTENIKPGLEAYQNKELKLKQIYNKYPEFYNETKKLMDNEKVNRTLGRNYFDGLTTRYDNPVRTLFGYNMGLGNTDKFKPETMILNDETRNYATKILDGVIDEQETTPSNNIIDAEKNPDFVINIKEDGSYEDFDEEAFEKMFPPLDRPAQDDSNNIVPELTVKDIPVSPPSAIDMMRNNYREGSIKRQNLSKQYKEGEVSDRPTVIPLFPKEPLTKQEADVLKRAQDVDQEFNYKKNDMLNAEKGFIPQQVQAQPDADVVYDNQGNPYNAVIPAGSVTGLNINQAKYDPTGGQQQSRQDLAKLANYDISIIDGNEFVHEKGLTEKEVEDQYNQRNQNQSSDDAGDGVMPTGEGILQDMSNAVKVPFLQDDFALYENETTGLDKARNLLGEPTTVYRDINGNLVQPNSKEQKPNNLRYLAGLLGSIMADRYGNPSQPEDNFSKYMAYTQDAIKQQRLDKQGIESQFGNYKTDDGKTVFGAPTPAGDFQTINGFVATGDDSSGSSGFPRDVIMGNGSTITMSEEQYKEHKKNEGKNAAERVEKLYSIRKTNEENNNNFDELLSYNDDQLNKLFGQSGLFDNQTYRTFIGAGDDEYKNIKMTYDFINDNKAKKAYVDILKGAGSISNYETEIMAKTINKLNVKMSAETLRKEIAKIQFLGQFHEHNAASAIPGYSDNGGTYKKLNTSEAYKLFLNNEIKDLNDYLNYKSRQ